MAAEEIEVERRIREELLYSYPCRSSRIHELAQPQRRLILALYQNHSHVLSKEKNDYIREMLSHLYAMSPEEAEKYFAKLQQEAAEAARRKRMKQKLRRIVERKRRSEQKRRAYVLFKNILKVGLRHAYTHKVPPLISARLRNMSDTILQQICDLRGLEVPDREDSDKQSKFLLSVADWMAIAVEHVYYKVELAKNEELEELEEIEKNRLQESMFEPKITSSIDKGEETEKGDFTTDTEGGG